MIDVRIKLKEHGVFGESASHSKLDITHETVQTLRTLTRIGRRSRHRRAQNVLAPERLLKRE